MEERNDQTSCQKLARPRPTAEDTLLRTPSSPPCSSRLSREVTLPTSGPGASARVRNSEAGSVLAPAGLISDCLCVWWQLGRVVSSTVANYRYHNSYINTWGVRRSAAGPAAASRTAARRTPRTAWRPRRQPRTQRCSAGSGSPPCRAIYNF